MKTNPLTTHDRQLLAMNPIAAQLPVKFTNGASWQTINCHCSECNLVLGRDEVLGRISKPFDNVAVLEAIGICIACNLFTRFEYRFHDDLRITGRRADGWHTWRSRKSPSSFFTKFKKIILGVFA
jgi:hypothetical protein